MKTLKEICSDYNAGLYFPDNTKYKVHPVPIWHIFNENLSAKENRALVDAHNDQVNAEKARRYRDTVQLENQLHQDVVNYIMDRYGLNEMQARMVESRTFTERHSAMSDYFASIDDDADWAKKLLSAK